MRGLKKLHPMAQTSTTNKMLLLKAALKTTATTRATTVAIGKYLSWRKEKKRISKFGPPTRW